MKQSTWLRSVLCGCWCLCMALRTIRGACQKRRRKSAVVAVTSIQLNVSPSSCGNCDTSSNFVNQDISTIYSPSAVVGIQRQLSRQDAIRADLQDRLSPHREPLSRDQMWQERSKWLPDSKVSYNKVVFADISWCCEVLQCCADPVKPADRCLGTYRPTWRHAGSDDESECSQVRDVCERWTSRRAVGCVAACIAHMSHINQRETPNTHPHTHTQTALYSLSVLYPSTNPAQHHRRPIISCDCRTYMEQSSYQHHSINLFAIFQETT